MPALVMRHRATSESWAARCTPDHSRSSSGCRTSAGPSAGTMFALGIIDKLTPENLSDDKIVAGTGTISPTGEVGAIGGIQQKMYAAQNGERNCFWHLGPIAIRSARQRRKD